MKKCPFCFEDIQDKAIKCKHCSSNLDVNAQHVPEKVYAKNHEDYMIGTLLSILLPPVGFVIGVISLTRKGVLNKKYGEHCIALSILFVIVWGLLFVVRIGVVLVNMVF